MSRIAVAIVTVLAMAGTAVAASWPDKIDLDDGFRPEGIATGRGHELFVGSIPTGAVYRIDARTGKRESLVAGGAGRAAIGLKVDQHDRLFVSGGPTGKSFIYDADTGAPLASFQMAPSGASTFVNDVALTRDGAFFTDSRRMVLYRVEPDLSGFEEIPLPDIPLLSGNNLNGIVATPDGSRLIAVQSSGQQLWLIDPDTGAAEKLDVGEPMTNGDGLLLVGRTLYVVQNRSDRIAKVRIEPDFSGGEVVSYIRHEDFDVPTTIARIGNRLYAPNARFTTPPTPDTEYWVTQVDR